MVFLIAALIAFQSSKGYLNPTLYRHFLNTAEHLSGTQRRQLPHTHSANHMGVVHSPTAAGHSLKQ